MTRQPFSRFAAASLAPLPRYVTTPPPKKSVDDLPPDLVAGMAARYLMLLALSWDYVETIQQLAKLLNAHQTKAASRRIHELRRAYNQRLAGSLSDHDVCAQKRIALLFEQICRPHLNKLHWALRNETKQRHPGLAEDWLDLVEAVDTALTVLDAASSYAHNCDSVLRAQGVAGHSMLTADISELIRLLPLFAGDCYNSKSEARKLTSRIRLNELKKIDLVDEHGNEM